ncbi:hypothetical protein CHRY9293_01433 [Chryseobacterium potabilaquae]|uniref:SH3b domain-containing protein n=2 Tax=Chryseobacterium potabilaquae TaxID=2675057 RepID=A0A6N4X550_9FLAO|nr:hypothetical protein CHRY9293_01433 [Chryseobacterium potabilaquae]
MLNKYIYIVIMAVTISCNGQNTQKDEKINPMEETEISILKSALENDRYKVKSEKDFKDRILRFFGINVDSLSNKGYDEILLNEEFIDYQISKQGSYIKIGQNLLPDLDSIRQKAVVNKEKYPYIERTINLNKILFLDDPISIGRVINQDKDLAIDLVVLFNYEENKFLTSTALKNIKSLDDQPKYFNWCLLFYNDRGKEQLIRKDLLLQLQKSNTDLISSLITFIVTNKNLVTQKVTDECLAFLINIKLKESKKNEDWNNNEGFGLLSYCYDTDKDLINRFNKIDFYNYSLIKNATEAYQVFNPENQIDYKIDDPDGYTNLRKEKNRSSEVLQKIKSGEHIEVLDDEGDWYLVKTIEGEKGYVHKSRIKK